MTPTGTPRPPTGSPPVGSRPDTGSSPDAGSPAGWPPADGPGLRLARGFFTEIVAPIVADVAPGLRYGAALIGPGSEVLGLDSARSTDHDFGPRVLLFLAADAAHAEDGAEPRAAPPTTAPPTTAPPSPGDRRAALARELDARLPASYQGFATRFTHSHDPAGTPPRHHVVLTTVAEWSRTALGLDITAAPLSSLDRLTISWQRHAEATGGAAFRDDLGELAAMRAALSRYPTDLRRYVLAAQWRRIAEEEAFVGRAGEVGDDTGSAVLAARLVRDLMTLALLQAGRYPPYGKWLGSAFSTLPVATTIEQPLDTALHATDWPTRGAALCTAYETLAAAQNEMRLAEPVDPTRRPFHDRPFMVLGAGRFADALTAAITDPEVAALPPLGCVDQFVDSTAVLADPARCRAVALAALAGPASGPVTGPASLTSPEVRSGPST